MTESLVYCTQAHVPEIRELQALANEIGWVFRVARDWLSTDGFHIVFDGPLADDDVLIGWPVEAELASEYDQAITACDRKKVDGWVLKWELGATMWASNVPFSFDSHARFGSLREARDQMGKKYADHLTQTKAMYVLTNCADMNFTQVIISAVTLLKNAMVEDPEPGGTLMFPPARNATMDSLIKSWPKFMSSRGD